MFIPIRRGPVFANPEGTYFANTEGSQFGGVLFLPIRKGHILTIRRGPNSEWPVFANPEGSYFANSEGSQWLTRVTTGTNLGTTRTRDALVQTAVRQQFGDRFQSRG